LLLSAPGIGWVLAFTIAGEIGEIERFPTPEKLTGYAGLCPRVNQSGESDRRGPLTKHGPRYLRWALIEATHARPSSPRLRRALPAHQAPAWKARGAKVAQIDIARRLCHAIWHMLTRGKDFAPPRRRFSSGGLTAPLDLRPRANDPISPDPPAEEAIET
jgi:transposase